MSSDSAYLQALLDRWCDAGPDSYELIIPPGQYFLEAPLTKTFAAPIGVMHTLRGAGAELVCAFDDAAPMLTIASTSENRYLTIEGLSFQGANLKLLPANPTFAPVGLSIEALGHDVYLEKATLRDIAVEQCATGIHLRGNVFQSTLDNVHCQDNRVVGLLLENVNGGVISALRIENSDFDQNGVNGVQAAPYPIAPSDFTFFGCYARNNGLAGFDLSSGCTLIAACGFENNWQAAADFARGGAGVKVFNFLNMHACSGATNDKQTYLVEFMAAVGGPATIIGCRVEDESAQQNCPIKLAKLSGPGRADVVLIGNHGAVT